MTKKILFCLFLSIGSLYLHAQTGVLVNLPPITNSMGQPIAGVTVSVFQASGPANALVCGAPVTVYSNAALSTPINPLVTDGFGNFPFYISPGLSPYGYTVSGQNTNSTVCYGFNAVTPVGSSPTFNTATFGGGIPWIDVTASPYSAACNDNGTGNGTDDTTAIQNALTAASLNGGQVIIPEGKFCRFTTTLNGDTFIHVGLEGGIVDGRTRNGNSGGFSAGLVYTGSTSPALSFRSSSGVAVKNITLVLTNAAFNGIIVETGHVNSSDTQAFLWQDNTLIATATSCNVGLSLDKHDNSRVTDSLFYGCTKQIRGAATAGSTSNVIKLERNTFQAVTGGTTTSCFIANPGANWTLLENDFEINGIAVGTLCLTDTFAGPTQGLVGIGNFDGDATGVASRTRYNFSGGALDGFIWEGNTIGGSSVNDNVFNLGSNPAGVSIHGNTSKNTTFGTYITCTGGSPQVELGPQNYANTTISTFSTCVPTSGVIWDNSVPPNPTWFGGGLTIKDAGATQHFQFVNQGNTAIDAAAGFQISLGTKANVQETSGLMQSQDFIANQGTVCTNGELLLSAGWQSTGTATVTAVAGTGQTCSWTITTGTTTGANPTVTDNLTNALPAATTVCEMNIHGGTHTPAAGEGFQQTTLSATAPVFTFNGTPTANGTTYFVTRRCGP